MAAEWREGVQGLAQAHPALPDLPHRNLLSDGYQAWPCLAGGAWVRCFAGGEVHGFPIEGESGAYCPEHEVTLLWRGDPITAADVTGGPGADLDGLSAGADGPYGVVCRSALVSGLPAVHAMCQRPDCVCPCHASPIAIWDAG